MKYKEIYGEDFLQDKHNICTLDLAVVKKMIVQLVLTLLVVCKSASAAAPQPSQTSDSSQAANPKRASEAELWLIRDHMKEGDKLLKELMQERYQSVKEQLRDGDTRLKEQVVEGDARLKEQLKDSSSKLKEKVSEEEEWMKEQLKRGATRRTEELQEQSKAIDTMRKLLSEWTKRNDATIAGLTEKMSDVTTQLQTTKSTLDSTKDRLRSTETELQAMQDTLQTTQDNLHTTHTSLQSTRQDLKATRKALENSTTDLQATKEDLQTTKDDLQTTKDDLRTTKDKLQTATDDLETTKEQLGAADNKISALQNSPYRGLSEQPDDPYYSDFTGSTFVRWGRMSCPSNTSLIYAGVIGGSAFDHTGGATSHLCLTLTPQFHSTTGGGNNVYGTEYEGMAGHVPQDAVCSVCRAPHPTTIMVPGTFVCPEGWTLQYSGYIATSAYSHKHGTDYICLDEDLEDRVGGHVDHNGNLLYYAKASCGSLPCPPYISSRTVTCAVCSA